MHCDFLFETALAGRAFCLCCIVSGPDPLNCLLTPASDPADPSSPPSMAAALTQPLPAAAGPAARLYGRQQAAGPQQQRAQLCRVAAAPTQVAAAAAAEKAAVPVTFAIGGSEVTVEAHPGQNIWEVRVCAGALQLAIQPARR